MNPLTDNIKHINTQGIREYFESEIDDATYLTVFDYSLIRENFIPIRRLLIDTWMLNAVI